MISNWLAGKQTARKKLYSSPPVWLGLRSCVRARQMEAAAEAVVSVGDVQIGFAAKAGAEEGDGFRVRDDP